MHAGPGSDPTQAALAPPPYARVIAAAHPCGVLGGGAENPVSQLTRCPNPPLLLLFRTPFK